jgi:hypothetical protein
MDNVQKLNNCINKPSSQNFNLLCLPAYSYFTNELTTNTLRGVFDKLSMESSPTFMEP